MTKWKKSKTNRGWTIYLFKDYYGEECSLQKSSSAECDQVWLGLQRDDPKKHPVFGDSLGMRMLIDRKLAAKLALKLAAFAETGEI